MWGVFHISFIGPSAVSGHADIALIRSRCSSELPASVACKSTAAPVRPRCPETLILGSSKKFDVRSRLKKAGPSKARTHPEGVLLDCQAFHASVHEKRHILPAEQGFGTAKVFS
jgi:hypothetical protein